MHQETTRSHSKLVPDVEAFQRVLAAVYTLQKYRDKLAEKDTEPNGDGSHGTAAEKVPAIQPGFPPPEVREPENVTYDAEAEREQSYLQHSKQRQFIPIISPMPTTMSIFAQWEPPAGSRRYSPKFVASAITVLGVLFAALWMASIPRSLPSWLAVHRYVRRHDARAALGDSVKVASEVAARIRADRRLQLARVQVSAGKSGILTLSGEVSNGAERLLAAQHASKVKGVNVVVDNLRVIEPSYPTNVATHALAAQAGGASKARTQAVKVNTLRVPAFAKTVSASSSHRRDANVAPSAPLSAETHIRGNAAGIGSASNPSTPAVAIRASKEVTVPYGTTILVQLTEALSSDLNRPGDRFSAKLVSPIMVGNRIAIPADATVQGEIVEVRSAGHFNGSSELVAKVTRLTYDGKTYNLRSSEYSTKSAAQDIQTAEIIGGGAGAGAILGAILGGKKGAAIGAVLGAGVGTGARAITKPRQIELPAQSTLSFRLESPLTVRPSSARG